MPRRILLAGFSNERGKHFDSQPMLLRASVDRPIHRKPPIRFSGKCQEKVHQYLSLRETYLSKTREVEALHVSNPVFMGRRWSTNGQAGEIRTR